MSSENTEFGPMLPRPILILVLFIAALAVGTGAGLSKRDLPKPPDKSSAIVFARDVRPLLRAAPLV